MNHNKTLIKVSACFLTGAIALTSPSLTAGAVSMSDLPSAGVEVALNDCYTASADVSIKEYLAPQEEAKTETTDKAVAKVDSYANMRKHATEDSAAVGKLYKDCVGTVVGSKDGWTKIESGSVSGYVKNDYLYLGEEAEAQLKKVGKKVATVNTTTLKVREKASENSEVLDLAPIGEEMRVLKLSDGWVGIKFNGQKGYVSADYVDITTVYKEAESKEEEEARLAAEEAARQAELERASAQSTGTSSGSSSSSSGSSSGSSSSSSGRTYSAPGSASGQAVANYACQFVGNPYKWGGSSLTSGADCSGFVMAVYSKFGVGLPHSSGALRGVGRGVSYSEAQPGDIICYSGHVGIYIGGGTIVNALNSRAGITYTSATYKSILAVRRIF